MTDTQKRLPVIVGFGGYNAAGRSSFHHAYRRTVLNSLDSDKRVSTLLSLASIMRLVEYLDGQYIDREGHSLTPEQIADKYQAYIEENTLIRKINQQYFDTETVPMTRELPLHSDGPISFTLALRDMPRPVPSDWRVETVDDKTVRIHLDGGLPVKMTSFREMEVKAAGILPTGFEPADLYNSRFHPRGLQMTVVGASDAMNSVGIAWQDIMDKVNPDEVAVFASSGLGQTDEYGMGGYLQARLRSGRPTSKQMALGLNSMPADFVNAYMCGSVGTTGAVAGACASFLYNLRLAVDDIAAGRHRVVICGSSEAAVNPEVIEGFAAMSALGTDERLAKLDGLDTPDYARASRPFGDNAGFTIGDSTQYFVLMDDQLAVELGAEIYGAVPHVYVNADGYKKSISSPGAGNYITLSKAVGACKAILGEESVLKRSFIQAHGSSTPQNRITESMVFDKVARGFGIEDWPVTAVKAFVGHPLGPASGDQLANTLGAFADGILPGIKTTHAVADDVVDERLDILLQDKPAEMDIAFLNSKGFGGNNATASVFSPRVVEKMLQARYGDAVMQQYAQKREAVRAQAKAYDDSALKGELNIIYNFGTGIIEDDEINISATELSLGKFAHKVPLEFENPYADMKQG